jgi:hypothetical protein
MHADTDAIRAYGKAHADIGTDLRAAATRVDGDIAPTVLAAFGPVGARFAAALAEAVGGLADRVAAIADDVTNSGAATVAIAAAYDDVERNSRTELARMWI